MKHLDFCKKVLANQMINQNELIEFIVDYCESKGKPTEKIQEYLPYLIQLIQVGQFDLIFAIKQCCADNNVNLYILEYKGNIIKRWIQE